MQWSPGSTAELTATFTTENGVPVDPSQILVDIIGPDGIKVDDGAPERISEGFYKFDYPIAVDAPEGLWRIEWEAQIGGLTAPGHENFEVLAADLIVTPSDSIAQSRLRSRLAEVKTDEEGDGSETFFDDAQITDILSYAGNDLDVATLEGWRRKMARYARLVDVNESGSDRKMSQKFKQAAAMVEFWEGFLGKDADALVDAFRTAVVGKAVNLRNSEPERPLTPFSGYSEHIREYPTHRLLIPAILS